MFATLQLSSAIDPEPVAETRVTATTDEAGRFRVEALPSGMVSLWVRVEDKEYFCGAFEAPSTGVEVAVPLR